MILPKLELLPAWLDWTLNRLVVEPLLLVIEYGLLVARLLPMFVSEVDDEIRCRL